MKDNRTRIFAYRLKEERLKKNYAVAYMAEVSGLTKAHIHAIEAQGVPNVGLETALVLADVLSVPLTMLLTHEPIMECEKCKMLETNLSHTRSDLYQLREMTSKLFNAADRAFKRMGAK